ncbi:MAG: hypothetical protein H6765_09070 [Candidatus Peribacteria bacterium]|nr:MAG: hypothetical protein H6765_09070 [Candidatus Peribacteria bacterium]
MTEKRYLSILALAWLVVISIYMIVSKQAYVYRLFVSLALLMAFG